MKQFKAKFASLIALGMLVFSAACQPKVEISPEPTAITPTSVDIPEATATAKPLGELTLCMAQEPQSLYLYDGISSRSKWNILEAIYDGPIDVIDGVPEAVILESLPTLENGGLTLIPTVVQPGQYVIDAHGRLIAFKTGAFVRPAGCLESACAVAWDGVGEFSLDVMTLRFKLIEGLKWSDGMPLSAQDSVLSYDIARDPDTPGNHWATDRTLDYRALDERTVEWQGLPGFVTADIAPFFFIPLPTQIYGGMSALELLQNDQAATSPLGWGAYRVEEWTRGEKIRLSANPHYWRAGEGLPFFDLLTVRFMTSADDAIVALENGQCDILDESYQLENRFAALLESRQGAPWDLKVLPGPEWDGLVFGIKPAAYDDAYTPQYGDRVDYFGDLRTRQAVMHCIDRQQILDEVYLQVIAELPGIAGAWDDLYELNEGARLLDLAGWKDVDADPQTARQAWGVAGITNGTPFMVSLVTTDSHTHQQSAQLIIDSLGACGIETNLQVLPVQELFAPGPEGGLFGRQFDLALFSWAAGSRNQCALYQSWQTPSRDNAWIGTNLSGYQDKAYDQACSDALLSLDGDQDILNEVFLTSLPVIPIHYRFRIVLYRVDPENSELRPSSRSWLAEIEEIRQR